MPINFQINNINIYHGFDNINQNNIFSILIA